MIRFHMIAGAGIWWTESEKVGDNSPKIPWMQLLASFSSAVVARSVAMLKWTEPCWYDEAGACNEGAWGNGVDRTRH